MPLATAIADTLGQVRACVRRCSSLVRTRRSARLRPHVGKTQAKKAAFGLVGDDEEVAAITDWGCQGQVSEFKEHLPVGVTDGGY